MNCSDVHLTRGHTSAAGERTEATDHAADPEHHRRPRVWLAERAGHADDPLFPTIRGRRLTRDALEHRIAKYIGIAAQRCPTLQEKSVTLHTLRHTAAMQLLHAGVDTTVIALWLGHERVDTTQIYLHADLALKERAMAAHQATRHQTRPIPAARYDPRLPPSALIMPTPPRRIRPPPKGSPAAFGIDRGSR